MVLRENFGGNTQREALKALNKYIKYWNISKEQIISISDAIVSNSTNHYYYIVLYYFTEWSEDANQT